MMIVILCETFDDAKFAFDRFISAILTYGMEQIEKLWEKSLCVETDDDLRYIFIDYHYANEFRHMGPDFVGEKAFFKLLDDYIFGGREYD